MILTFLLGLVFLSVLVIYRVAAIERHYARRLESSDKLRLRQVGEAITKLKTAEERSNMLQGQLAKLHNEKRDAENKPDDRVERIVKELSNIRWNRKEQGRYFVTVEFDPKMLGFGAPGPGNFDREDLRYIARYLGDMVTHDVASYKFVQKANEEEDESWRRRRPFASI